MIFHNTARKICAYRLDGSEAMLAKKICNDWHMHIKFSESSGNEIHATIKEDSMKIILNEYDDAGCPVLFWNSSGYPIDIYGDLFIHDEIKEIILTPNKHKVKKNNFSLAEPMSFCRYTRSKAHPQFWDLETQMEGEEPKAISPGNSFQFYTLESLKVEYRGINYLYKEIKEIMPGYEIQVVVNSKTL